MFAGSTLGITHSSGTRSGFLFFMAHLRFGHDGRADAAGGEPMGYGRKTQRGGVKGFSLRAQGFPIGSGQGLRRGPGDRRGAARRRCSHYGSYRWDGGELRREVRRVSRHVQAVHRNGAGQRFGAAGGHLRGAAHLGPRNVIAKNIRLIGCLGGNFPGAIELIRSGKADTRPFVTHRFSLDEAGQAFRTQLEDRDAIKVMITP